MNSRKKRDEKVRGRAFIFMVVLLIAATIIFPYYMRPQPPVSFLAFIFSLIPITPFLLHSLPDHVCLVTDFMFSVFGCILFSPIFFFLKIEWK